MQRRMAALLAALVSAGTSGCSLLAPTRPVEVPPAPVSVTESGLQIEELSVGEEEGPVVEQGSRIRVHYTGWTIDGFRFDSSHDRGRPVTFTVGAGDVVAGWEEGMLGMRKGGIRKITIPPELGYGAEGLPGRIPPSTNIVLEVELVAIVKPDEEELEPDGEAEDAPTDG